jgi:glycerol uptake facilitator-like aquaporin
MSSSLLRRCTAEGIGTTLLLATVVGSGIMAERLAGGNIALALLANSVATGAGLAVYILVFEPVSGAHFNPVVTISSALVGRFSWHEVPAYLGSQLAGAFAGVAAAHVMFGEKLFVPSSHARAGLALCFAEAVAAFGLLCVVVGLSRKRPGATAPAVGAYIASAYWFTSSTSFANPAVTLARAFTDTFTGIRLLDVPGFVTAQLLGAIAAVMLFEWLGREANAEVSP